VLLLDTSQTIPEAAKDLNQPLRDGASVIDMTLEKLPVAPTCQELDLPVRENSTREDLENLVTDIRRIADTKSKAARCMDDQVAALCCHAKLLSWMCDMLPKDISTQELSTCRTTASTVISTNSETSDSNKAMCEKIRYLRQSIDQQLQEPSGMIESMVTNSLSALSANEKLLTSMTEDIRNSFGEDEAKTPLRVMFV